VSEATRGLFEGFDHVEALDREWPGDGDDLKFLRRQMSLPSIEMASFTPADHLLCISQCSGPVKTLAKGFPDQRSWGRVISTDSSMDFEEKLFPLVGWDALNEHSRRTSLVKFVTNGDERLGMLSDSSHFSPFRWENLLEEVGEQWCSPVDRIECHHGDVAGRRCRATLPWSC